MNLSYWQTRLQDSFNQLCRQRSDKHIFGLEHGLDTSELVALENAINEHISQSPPSDNHLLPWIVYASEFGYKYAGDEYWQTFEQHTPGWKIHGDRYWIRQCFRKFHSIYRGARPSGSWAKHFSIICWPITHAILPQDLQRQLANILYDLRHTFRPEFFESPELLGKQIAAHSWNATSRFQNFAQEPLLVGQIATALLFHRDEFSKKLILPATLLRIVDDLDRERRSREWLRDAQKLAQQVHLHGLQKDSGISKKNRAADEHWHNKIAALAIEPRLVLRPKTPTLWDVFLEIPDFSPLLKKFPKFHTSLAESRCSVTGAATRSSLARGRLLYGSQRIALKTWPKHSDMLLRFESSSPELDYLLRTDCLLRPGPTWLFRIASDRLAYEVRSKVVRSGNRYIFLDSTGPIHSGSFGIAISISCEGIHGILLDLSAAITNDVEYFLEKLGLKQAKNIHVWPVGLPAADWDGEGRGEWLSTDRPCIGIRVDHSVEKVSLSINGNGMQSLDIEQKIPGEIVFVELPSLFPGVYKLHVFTHSYNPEFNKQSGQLEFVIREPRKWTPNHNYQCPLFFVIDPPTPTLEQLWEGLTEIEIYGPKEKQVGCCVKLFEKSANKPIFDKNLPPLKLPVDTSSWRAYFERNFRKNKEIHERYDLAHVCQIDFHANELGKFSLRCEREFTPIRWIIRSKRGEYNLTLLDDTGIDTPIEIHLYGFENPDEPVPIKDTISFTRGYKIPGRGGMYLAQVGQQQRSIIIPPLFRQQGDLQMESQFHLHTRSVRGINKLLDLFDLWSTARIPGNFFAMSMQRNVLKSFVRHIYGVICDIKWKEAENNLRCQKNQEALDILRSAISKKHNEINLVSTLGRDYARFADADFSISKRVSFLCSLAKSVLLLTNEPKILRQKQNLLPNYPEWLTEFALRLASDPINIRSWSGENFLTGIECLLEIPTLAKAARFLVLGIDYRQSQQTSWEQLYSGWKWE